MIRGIIANEERGEPGEPHGELQDQNRRIKLIVACS